MKYAGIHLSGSNTQRSAVVILASDQTAAAVRVEKIYQKIGSTALLFSDERLVQILSLEGPFAEIMVDCPLTLPPCVSCLRPQCPGVVACEDVSVAYMLALNVQLKLKGVRKKRPVNPQSQRLWDMMHGFPAAPGVDPTFNSNMAPLAVRARTLQKRLQGVGDPELRLRETSVPHVLLALTKQLGLDDLTPQDFRSFEHGRGARERFMKALIRQNWIADVALPDQQSICGSVDVFAGFISAVVANLAGQNRVAARPALYPAAEGWVDVPV